MAIFSLKSERRSGVGKGVARKLRVRWTSFTPRSTSAVLSRS